MEFQIKTILEKLKNENKTPQDSLKYLLHLSQLLSQLQESISNLPISHIPILGLNDLKILHTSFSILSKSISNITINSDYDSSLSIIHTLILYLPNHPHLSAISQLLIHQHLTTIYSAILDLIHHHPQSALDSTIANLLLIIPQHSSFISLLSIYSKKITHKTLACGKYLSQLLTTPSGISSFLGIFIPKTPSVPQSLDPKIINMISKIILSIPQHLSLPDYIQNASSQLVPLLSDSGQIKATVASTLCLQIILKYQTLARKFIIQPIISPIRLLFLDFYYTHSSMQDFQITHDSMSDLDGNPIIVSENDLDSCIIKLKYLLSEAKADSNVMESISTVIRPLYFIYQFIFNSTSNLKNSISDIIQAFLSVSDRYLCLNYLKSMALNPLQDTLLIVHGSLGGIAFSKPKDPVKSCVDVDVFMNILDLIQDTTIISDLFLQLLEFNFISNPDDVITVENPQDNQLRITIILAIMNKYGAEILSKAAHVILFIKNIFSSNDEELIPLALALLAAIFTNDQVVTDDFNPLDFQDIITALYSLSSVKEDGSKSELQLLSKEVLDMILSNNLNINSDESRKQSFTKFQEALKSLADPLLPIRAYGLNILRSMILRKDPITHEKLDLIINIFLEQLEDSDSFIYLNSIKGISALTEIYPESTLFKIIERYQDMENYSLDYRLRIGEAILQTIQKSGKSFLKHGKTLLEVVLKIMHEDSIEMKSSAMSCLAMISQTDVYALSPYMFQIMDYFYNLLIFEKTAETRRAAVYNFHALISSLDPLMIKSAIPVEILKKIQTQLEYLIETDQDDLTISHSQHTLDAMNIIIQDYMNNF